MPEAGWWWSSCTAPARWWSFADGTSNDVAAPLAEAGIAVASISLPFHGERSVGGSETLMSFNVLNPTAGRTNLRQAAAEAVWLNDMFLDETRTTTTLGGTEIRFDPTRVAYKYPHGAVMGSIAMAYFDPRLRGVVLSGAGGGLSLSVVVATPATSTFRGYSKTLRAWLRGRPSIPSIPSSASCSYSERRKTPCRMPGIISKDAPR